MKWQITLLAAGLILAGNFTCANPVDFRTRLSRQDVSLQDQTADVRAEIEFGREVAVRVLSRYRLVDMPALDRYLNLVGSGVALKGPRAELVYHFAVLDSDEINAYAAPGGYIFITRGAIAQMRDEAELAAVLAHEMGHIAGRHIVRELNIRGRDDDPGAGLAQFFGGATHAARNAFAQAADQAVAMLFTDGYKREDEFDADRTAALLLANAGYDPLALPRFLQRVQKAKGEPSAKVYRTHPPFNTRLGQLTAFIRGQGLDTLHYPTVKARFERETSGGKQP